MKRRYPLARIAGLVTGLTLVSLSTSAVAESQSHARFETQVRAGIVGSLAKNHFMSDCFIAENGLHARVDGHVDDEHNFILDTRYYFDRECTSSAGMSAEYRGKLQAKGRDLNTFGLDGFGSIMIVRDAITIVFMRGTETVHLAMQEAQ